MNASAAVTRRLAPIAGAALLLPAVVFAQKAATPAADTLTAYSLEGVTVTVTRFETRRRDVPQRVEVIPAADLQGSTSDDVTDVLKKQAAVDVIQYPGLLSGVGIRGFRPEFSGIHQRTLVLIDGRPAGTANLSLLGLEGIEQIEVLKGPASALYGSNSMGGVVNLITRTSQGDPSASISAGYGSFDSYRGALTAGGSLTEALDFDLGLEVFDRNDDYRVGDGNLFRDWLGDGAAVRTFANDSTARSADPGSGEVRPFTRYGYWSGNLRLGYDVGGDWRIDTRAERFAADRVQSPGDILVTSFDTRTLKDVARTGGDAKLSGSLGGHELMLRLYSTREESDFYSVPEETAEVPQFINFRSQNRWRGLQVQDALRWSTHTLTAGFDYASARARSARLESPGTAAPPFSPDSRVDSRAVFAQARLEFLDNRIVGTLGGRIDRISFDVAAAELFDGTRVEPNRESFTVFNPSFGVQGRLGGGVRLHASGGRAFVSPDAFFVAGQAIVRTGEKSVAITTGNPDLDPENSVTWDVGIDLFRPDRGVEADLTYFHTDVRDRITSRRTVPPAPRLTPAGDTVRSVTTYVNANEAGIRGLEWTLGYDLGTLLRRDDGLRLSAGATHILRAEEIAGGSTSPILNVADLTLNYGIEYESPSRFRARLSGRYVGERMDNDFTDFTNPALVRYPEFMVLDLAARLHATDRYRFDLLVSNLTDEHYYEVRGYPLPGRSYEVRVTAEF